MVGGKAADYAGWLVSVLRFLEEIFLGLEGSV